MVTAVLPSMTGFRHNKASNIPEIRVRAPTLTTNESDTSSSGDTNRNSVAFSTESGSTITPTSYARSHSASSAPDQTARDTVLSSPAGSKASSPPRLAGIVGLFTGLGALLALSIFLPLPSRFQHLEGVTPALALKYAFYTVGTIAFLVSLSVFIGLHGLQGEEGKGWRLLFGSTSKLKHKVGYTPLAPNDPSGGETEGPLLADEKPTPYYELFLSAGKLGFTDNRITLAYLGGFVARASSVAISLFIPLSINVYFLTHAIGSGACEGDPTSPEYKKNCRGAYILASMVTGTSQLVALLCAPLFGYLSDRFRRFEAPLLVATICGLVGYIGFANLKSPEIKDEEGRGGGPLVLLWVSLIGVSQIGAIVCSLGLLGRGIQGDEDVASKHELEEEYHNRAAEAYHDEPTESGEEDTSTVRREASGVSSQRSGLKRNSENRAHLKGSIAGIYSFTGGAAILLLTKLGGKLFDSLSHGAPFYMMAIFNAILGGVALASVTWRECSSRRGGAISLS